MTKTLFPDAAKAVFPTKQPSKKGKRKAARVAAETEPLAVQPVLPDDFDFFDGIDNVTPYRFDTLERFDAEYTTLKRERDQALSEASSARYTSLAELRKRADAQVEAVKNKGHLSEGTYMELPIKLEQLEAFTFSSALECVGCLLQLAQGPMELPLEQHLNSRIKLLEEVMNDLTTVHYRLHWALGIA